MDENKPNKEELIKNFATCLNDIEEFIESEDYDRLQSLLKNHNRESFNEEEKKLLDEIMGKIPYGSNLLPLMFLPLFSNPFKAD